MTDQDIADAIKDIADAINRVKNAECRWLWLRGRLKQFVSNEPIPAEYLLAMMDTVEESYPPGPLTPIKFIPSEDNHVVDANEKVCPVCKGTGIFHFWARQTKEICMKCKGTGIDPEPHQQEGETQ